MSKDGTGVSDKLTAAPLPGPGSAVPVPPATPGAPTTPPTGPAMREGIIREVVYKDNLGNRLIERIPVMGILPGSKFVGVRPSEVLLPADVQTAMGMAQRAEMLEFQVPGDDPVTAFMNYDACFLRAVNAFRQRVSDEVTRIRGILDGMRAKTPPDAPAGAVASPAPPAPSVPVTTAIPALALAQPATGLTEKEAAAAPARKAPRSLTKGGAPPPARTPPQGPSGRRRA